MKNYPQRYQEVSDQMGRLAEDLPGPMKAFMELHEASVKPGALDGKTKELIALGIAITVRCDGCIAYHVHDALQAGASRREVAETIGVAVMMGGGPSVVYGAEAHAALEQFERAPAEV